MLRHAVLFKWKADVTDADKVYQGHPQHLRVIQEHIRPAIATRAAAQYRV